MNNTLENTVSVSELTRKISNVLSDWVGFVRVSGEISNYIAHSSGHKYFTLKDSKAQISCVFWKTRQLSFAPADGMKVIIEGNITVYPPRGNYQIDCTKIIQEGQGDLYLQFEELKAKLQDAGYFDTSHKKQIPRFPLNIGISTSPTGAAVRDMIETIKQRLPLCNVYFRPTLVQGEGSAADIAQAIKDLDNSPADVIIVGRGGGSIEDLWSYNTEIVAGAVYHAQKPIISAVGHETDFTIADFVADIRAATPTAAAVMVTPDTKSEITGYLDSISDNLGKSANRYIESSKERLNSIEKSYFFRLVPDKIRMYQQAADELESHIKNKSDIRIKFLKQELEHLSMMCMSLHPMNPLKRGFALIKKDGRIIPNTESLDTQKHVEIHRLNESAEVIIDKVIKHI